MFNNNNCLYVNIINYK